MTQKIFMEELFNTAQEQLVFILGTMKEILKEEYTIKLLEM